MPFERVRPPTTDERVFYLKVAKLLADTRPSVNRVGQLDEILVPSGKMYRDAKGRLWVHPTARSLSNDSVLNRRRRKAREPDESELARWRQVQRVLERAAPSVGRDGGLVELALPYGEMKRNPFGELVVREERLAPVSVTLSRDLGSEDGIAPPEPPQPEEPVPDDESWRATVGPDIPVAIPVRERGAARRNSDDLYGTVVRGYATPRGHQAQLRKKMKEYARKHSCPLCRQPLRRSVHEQPIHARTAMRGGPISDLSLSGHQRRLWLSKPIQSQLSVSPSFVADGPETVLPKSESTTELSYTTTTM